jgi:DNA-binding SARP family transcriptional activator
VDTNPVVRILGAPSIVSAQEGVFFPAKGFQLIALLALSPSYHMSRKELASLLWESESESLALSNLRQLLSRMKKAVADSLHLLEIDASSIALGGGGSAVDLCLFEAAPRHGDSPTYLETILLVRGDLLDGIGEVTDQFSH